MICFNIQAAEDTLQRTAIRDGETKLGQTVRHCSSLEALKQDKTPFVIFGIAEDMGVQANHGKKGAALAWTAFLNAFVNIQDNQANSGTQMLVLGHFEIVPTAYQKSEALGSIVEKIDTEVAALVQQIVSLGKYL